MKYPSVSLPAGRLVPLVRGESKSPLQQGGGRGSYKKYTDRFDIDSVPAKERLETAKKLADIVLAGLKKETINETNKAENTASCS